MKVKKPAISYKVGYRGKAPWEDIGEGFHANFCTTIKEAEEAVAACKKWYNNVVVKEPIVKPMTGEVIKAAEWEFRDNVYVWIETFVDGQFKESTEDEICGLSSEEPEKKQPTGLTGNKSRKPNLTESAQTNLLETVAD